MYIISCHVQGRVTPQICMKVYTDSTACSDELVYWTLGRFQCGSSSIAELSRGALAIHSALCSQKHRSPRLPEGLKSKVDAKRDAKFEGLNRTRGKGIPAVAREV